MSRLINVVISPLPDPLTYAVPDALSENVTVGSLVEVPLGKRTATGYVIENNEQKLSEISYKIKEIEAAPLHYPCFREDQIEFFQWVADYYAENISQVLDLAIPSFVPPRAEKILSLTGKSLEKGGIKQRAIVQLLEERQPRHYREILQIHPRSHTTIKKLHELGIVGIDEKELVDSYLTHVPLPSWAKTERPTLSEEQSTTVDDIQKQITAEAFTPTLLHGVTGSGKTEVYIEAIETTLAAGRGVLILVPEIALTPQLVDRFRARLGNNIGVLHSGLQKRKRWDAWRALLEGRCKIALGARSAIFAPVEKLGLIVVDEEHDSSFKQSEGFRYNARDLAIVRAKLSSCPVILGSATPSLESYYNAGTKKYHYHHLSKRQAGHQELDIKIVNLNSIRRKDMPSPNVSPELLEKMKETFAKNEQAFLLYNRRGFASYLQCNTCGQPAECPNCAVTLTYHQSNHTLLCHYCGIQIVPPEYCTQCTSEEQYAAANGASAVVTALDDDSYGKLTPRGAGTEKIFEEIKELLPDVRVDRLDRDTAQNINDYRAVLDRMRSGETQLLVGTQMIAKGHDIPNVTLVGVVDCDVGLHMPDFRSSERIFQLLMQTSGRAGRGEQAGTVVLQTRLPEHGSILRTQDHNFKGYAKSELQMRKVAYYPPFSKMVRIVSASQDRNIARSLLKRYKMLIEQEVERTQENATFILGPTSAPLEKLKTKWRYHLLLKSDKATTLNRMVRYLKNQPLPSTKLKVTFDIDPQDML